jgi:hypothetical protein
VPVPAGDRPPRVAIIDSGVHALHPHVQGVAGGVGVADDGTVHGDFVDCLGHGTAVTAAVREKAPRAEIFVIRIFERELRATAAALVAAVRVAIGEGADLINLSLGTLDPAHQSSLNAVVDAVRAANMELVCAAPQGDRRWLPGAMPGVLRVWSDMTIPRDACEVVVEGEEISARASGYPRPIPGVPPERNLKGISFAVANTTGLLASTWPFVRHLRARATE